MRWEDIRHWIVDDSKAISEWIVRGTFEDDSKLDCLGCDLWEFRGGLITKKDTYWKLIADHQFNKRNLHLAYALQPIE